MGKITARKRNSLPSSKFALPKQRKYPVDTKGRARNALSRGAANASPGQQAKIRAKVHRAFPSIKIAAQHKAVGHYEGKR